MKILLAAALLASPASAQKDEAGSKDHPLFTRLPGYYISSYSESEFDSHEFPADAEDGKRERVEGRKFEIGYSPKRGARKASDLQIMRNHSNAVKAIGGQVLKETDDESSFRLIKPGREVWAQIKGNYAGGEYDLVIVEKGEMAQEVTASDMLAALKKEGRMALYINFDTGKADIRTESLPLIDEMIKLLQQNPKLRLGIEGHTDTIGGAKRNLALSKARAQAVVDALTTAEIAASRLQPSGHGPAKPLADNDTEEGRAKNRRVEIVKL